MDEIVVSEQRRPRQSAFQQYQPPGQQAQPEEGNTTTITTSGPRGQQEKRYEFINGEWVQLTAAGVPRKKPGRKPGTQVKPKTDADQAPKTRKPRSSRGPEASASPAPTPVSRKRKIAPSDEPDAAASDAATTQASTPLQQPAELHAVKPGFPTNPPSEHRNSPKMAKREGYPSSMQSILNDDIPMQTTPPNASAMPVRTGGQTYDPIRGSYRDSPSNNTLSVNGSPRPPAHTSPSIASLIDPPVPAASPSVTPGLPAKAPDSPSPAVVKQATIPKPVIDRANFTTIANGPIRKVSPSQKGATGVSTPRTELEEFAEMEGRSILDFGKAKPGEEQQAPSIVISIPINVGENNKYVNFMRVAEERYGWDALHPRQAANRDRKARIAAATASLEKVEGGRESGDEMSLDLSDGEGSNAENGGTSGVDAQVKVKKKRNFKEDQYDVDDDFVDDSEMLWEAQAAASRDGFFVYSGPLVPEVEKPAKYANPFTSCMIIANRFAAMFLPDHFVAEAAEAARWDRLAEAPAVVAALVPVVDAAAVLVLAVAQDPVVVKSPADLASQRQSACCENKKRRAKPRKKTKVTQATLSLLLPLFCSSGCNIGTAGRASFTRGLMIVEKLSHGDSDCIYHG